MSESDDEPRKHLRLRRRWRGAGHESSNWPAPRPPVTNPKEIVAANVEHERRAGLYRVKPMRKRWRRRGVDFLLMAALGNGLGIGFLTWIEPSAVTSLLTLSGMLFYTLALGWVVFVHHDEY
jgi:hypothetical protein